MATRKLVPIPVRPTQKQRDSYVTNIRYAWTSASEDQRQRGRNWYTSAHELADMMSGGNPVIGAGVIAALSANKAWEQNILLAADALNGTVHKHVKNALAKVTMILAGHDPATVLNLSLKTGMFYRCIADPSDPDAVVIDRHAHDVAFGKVLGNNINRGLSSATRYAVLANAYREAAYQEKELPMNIQSSCWLYWRETHSTYRAANVRRLKGAS